MTSLNRRSSSVSSGLPTVAVLPIVCAAVVALGLAWTVLDDASAGMRVATSALLAAFPLGYLLSAWLPLRLAVRRGAAVGLRLTEPALHTAQRITVIVLDKSGTITADELAVVSVDPVEPDHDRNLRWFAGALEHSAEDPVGRAIAKLAGRGHLTDVVQTPGFGISGSVDRHPVRVGRPDWIGLDHVGGDGTTVAVEVDARALGHITVDDVVREDALASVDRLRTLGLAPVLVSDGTSHNTERLGVAVGIDVLHAEVAPEKRARVVTELQEAGQVVAMVGPSPANADALEVADLAVCSGPAPGPSSIRLDTLAVDAVAGALSLSRTALSVIRTNRVIGLVTPVVGLVGAGLGVLSPLLGLVFGVVAALLVVGNSLRLRAAAKL
ncbi:HAD family hydrolase [Nocardioides sp. Soil796]|uniref:HAD family hydrolase n=1 Tax=Nocardioides sp. Soil796 TaxID=1736412 RepID=UPI0009E9B80D|nr:HAD family hydrolase [Nocardioides sp. Soil796]